METFDEWYDRQPLVLLDCKAEHRLTWEAAIASQQEWIAELTDLLEEQKGTIKALNWSLGGEDSTSTENLIDAHEMDYADEGLIALCRKLTQENVRLEDVVLCQKKAWAADYEELELLRDQLASSESSPITEEVEDILRSEIAKRDARIAELEQDLQTTADALGHVIAQPEECYPGIAHDFEQAKLTITQQSAEIARLKAVIGKCKETLGSNISDLQEPNFVTLASWRVREALAAIKEEGL